MQHYIQYGYGFLSSKITENEFIKAQEITENDPSLQSVDSKVGFVFISHTEDYPEYGWSTAVLRSLGEVPNYGKAITLTEFNEINKKYGVISDRLKSEFLDCLKKVGLEHLIDKVELVIYSDNY